MQSLNETSKSKFISTIRNKLLTGAATLTISNVLSSALGIISIPLLIKQIGLTGFGELILVQSIAFCFCTALAAQSWQTLIKFMGLLDPKGSSENHLILLANKREIYGLFLALLSGLIATLMLCEAGIVKTSFLTSSLIFLSVAASCYSVPTGVLRAKGKFKSIACGSATPPIIKVLCFALIPEISIQSAALIYLASELGRLLIITPPTLPPLLNINTNNELKKIEPDFNKSLHWIKISRIADLPVQHLDKVLISLVINEQAVAVYFVLRRVGNFIALFSEPFAQIFYPVLSNKIRTDGLSAMLALAKKYIAKTFIILSPIAMIMIMSVPLWLNILIPESGDNHTIQAVLIIAISYIGATTSIIHLTFNLIDKEKHGAVISVLANAAYLSTACALGFFFGIYGVIAALSIQYLSAIAPKYYIISRKLESGRRNDP